MAYTDEQWRRIRASEHPKLTIGERARILGAAGSRTGMRELRNRQAGIRTLAGPKRDRV